MERKVLGRGLESLIPTGDQGIKERVQMLKITQIQASRFQPRLNFAQDKIAELARSIKEKGVIQPIIVRATENVDQYELIAGERRFRAVKHLGQPEIPAIIRRVADADVLEMSIIENIQREELNVVEEAKAYKRLGAEFGLTQDMIAERVGKDKSSVSNLLRILNLPEKILNFITQDTISFGHAKALLSLLDEKHQMALCDKIIKKGLSVRQTEILSQGKKRSQGRSAARFSSNNADIRSLEEKLQHRLGTRVRIHHAKKRGTIVIEYFSSEDLERVLKLLGVSPF